MEKSKRLYTLSLLIVISFFISICYHYFQGFYYNKPYPANTFLFLPNYFISDFGDVYRESINMNPYLGEKSGQFPFLIIIGKLFTILHGYSSYIPFLLIGSIAFAYYAIKYLKIDPWYSQATSIFVICFLSYPFLISIDRGNFEFLLFTLLLIFIYLFEKKKYFWSTLPLAMAIAMKVFPAILLVIFISEKRWKELLVSIGVAFTLTLGSLCLFQGGFLVNAKYIMSLSNFSNNSLFSAYTSIEPGAYIQRGVTIVTLFKIVLGNAVIIPSEYWIKNFKLVYMIIAAVVGVIIILFVIFKEKVLVFLMLLLPPLSADYKLIHIYIPLFLFCNNSQLSKLDDLYVLFFAILIVPKDYYFFEKLASNESINNLGMHDISIATPINIIILIIFTIILIINNKSQQSEKGQLMISSYSKRHKAVEKRTNEDSENEQVKSNG
jgi:hypothetical protein